MTGQRYETQKPFSESLGLNEAEFCELLISPLHTDQVSKCCRKEEDKGLEGLNNQKWADRTKTSIYKNIYRTSQIQKLGTAGTN